MIADRSRDIREIRGQSEGPQKGFTPPSLLTVTLLSGLGIVLLVVGWLLYDKLGPIPFLGAVQTGLIYGFVGLGVYLSFRVLNFPDLTVDGSFPLGGAVAAVLIVGGTNPWLAVLAAIAAGCVAGLVTAALNVQLKILHLLASILTMIALYSINLRIMGQPNIPLLGRETVLTPFYGHGLDNIIVRPLLILVLLIAAVFVLGRLLTSNFGLGLRASGANSKMAVAQGIRTGTSTYVGMAISNGLVALGGAIFAQATQFADVTLGVGTIVVGLAAVIVGEAILPFRGVWVALISCILGSVLYRLALQFALDWDGICIGESLCIEVNASDLNLITAVLVALALIAPRLRGAVNWRRH